ncbi:MAG TPA: DUF6134 family protein [Chitinophagales bacterium]|nr:DUF6134 family protein [Chitinophagales bacterium]
MKILFAFSLIALQLLSSAQKLTYGIYLFGGRIGESVIDRTVVNDSVTHYTLHSSSEAHIFFSVRKIQLHYDVYFKNGFLFSSYSKHVRNDEVQLTNISLDGNHYNVTINGKNLCITGGLINCSTIRLFYNEPCSTDKMLSERLGEFRQVRKTGEGTYEADMSEGITYIYRYKNGKLIELEMKKGFLGSVYLRLE